VKDSGLSEGFGDAGDAELMHGRHLRRKKTWSLEVTTPLRLHKRVVRIRSVASGSAIVAITTTTAAATPATSATAASFAARTTVATPSTAACPFAARGTIAVIAALVTFLPATAARGGADGVRIGLAQFLHRGLAGKL